MLKKTFKLFILLTTMIMTSAIFAAENFTVFDNVTFNAPFTDGMIATSAEFTNTSAKNSVKIVLEYKSVASFDCNCLIYAAIEEEIVDGVWVTIAAQNGALNGQLNAPTRVIDLSPAINVNQGQDIFYDVGAGVKVSHTQGVAPSKFRVKLFYTQYTGTGQLTALTINVTGKKYDH